MKDNELHKLYGDLNRCVGEVISLEATMWIVIEVQHKTKVNGYTAQECCEEFCDKLTAHLEKKRAELSCLKKNFSDNLFLIDKK